MRLVRLQIIDDDDVALTRRKVLQTARVFGVSPLRAARLAADVSRRCRYLQGDHIDCDLVTTGDIVQLVWSCSHWSHMEQLPSRPSLQLIASQTRQLAIRSRPAILRALKEKQEKLKQRALVLEKQKKVIEHQAMHDPLTGLANRALLMDRFKVALRVAVRKQGFCSLLMMDLNRFKEVNDTLGHHIGDLLLQEVGKRLKSCLRRVDTLARLGGDEFAVVLLETDINVAATVGKKLLDILLQPFNLEGEKVCIGSSVGVAVYPLHGETSRQLLQHADVAMYHAKRNRLGVTVYSSKIDAFTGEQLALANDLKSVVNTDQLMLFYQPQLDLNGKICSLEALLRWHHPERGLLLPGEFVPLAEETGVIQPLTNWILEHTIGQCALWRQNKYDVGVCVNLSAHNLEEVELVKNVKAFLDNAGLPPERLTLEVTETILMEDTGNAVDILWALHDMGVEISVNDFGTGYSSLGRLKQLPLTELKMDRSFITEMESDQDNMIIVRSIITLAHNLGLRVTAEGVEEEKVWKLLCEMKCDRMQGSYFSEPLPVDVIDDNDMLLSK